MASADLVLHPVRFRIVRAFLGRSELTTAALREELSDVPTASLYRQIGTLIDGGVLEVVAERRVRGAVERTLALRAGAASVDAEDAAGMTTEQHQQAFVSFVAGLVQDFGRYLAGGDVDLERDLVGYRQAVAHLSDEEMRDFVADLRAVIQPRLENGPAEGRTRRLITTILMPADPPTS